MIPSLGRLYVQDLTPVRVQQYYGELRRKGLANNTIRKHHVLLHAVLGAAVRQGIVGGERGLAGGERHHRGGAVSVRETEPAARAGQGAATAALAAPFP